MKTRRTFLKTGACAGAGLLLPWKFNVPSLLAGHRPERRHRPERIDRAGFRLDPRHIPKFVTPLVVPPAMPRRVAPAGAQGVDYYEIAMRQFRQHVLPHTFPATEVWGYGSVHHPESFNFPAFTIEATSHRPVRVKWINGLVDRHGNYLPHLLSVDPTLHWANPAGPRDERPTFSKTPRAYDGPVPIVTHLHGGHTAEEGDGFPEAWFLPNAKNIPEDYFRTGTYYEPFRQQFESKWGQRWERGTAIAQYLNDQRSTTLWYHDHTLGMTRVNVYAGPAGFYLLRGGASDLPPGALPGPAPALGDAAWTRYYEIPIVIQDRSFNHDGSLFYPQSRRFFDDFAGPYIPHSDISPIWNPEFFGDTIVVNGRTWPFLNVESRRYRFRFLNGCDARFLLLKLVTHPLAPRPAVSELPIVQIGSDGGFLPAPVQLQQLLIAPAERADVIIDFTNIPPGTKIFLINEAPDEPFGGGEPGKEFEPADPRTTGQIMRFNVGPLTSADTSLPVEQLTLLALNPLPEPLLVRRLSLNEDVSAVLQDVGPRAALLGILGGDDNPIPLMWEDAATERTQVGLTELWEIYNFTEDAHPIHIHQVQFQVVNRQRLVAEDEGVAAVPASLFGDAFPPEPWETGFKDTVIAYPGQVTRLKATFDLPGRFTWHCHILEHEDNEMMRPLEVLG